ncbi:iron-dependent repressor [Halorubrum sp. DM2]|uniref:metal-dependent transcriptional regulator n=1 Tax=Halorubrum sp. DM2 TaxID=2527867 RepID=UPI0024B7F088|nr:metal-dependent transcriptional regulator [Halorubrum sp. DM2]VTT85128.1 iron-dependent repressor [Halorubrum sp. DM2]
MTAESDYLLALFIAEQQSSPPISSGQLATALDRSQAATTEMFQRLETEGLVEYEPYEGAKLTSSGCEQAEALHETYVTLSWFFRSVLDLDTHEREAMRMAGLVSPTVAERLAETLVPADEVPDEEAGSLSEY